MKNIYIHIGREKTGTTTIQRGLQINFNRLKKEDYLFATNGLTNNERVNHNAIAFEFLGDPRYNPKQGSFAALVQEVEKTKFGNVVISGEALNYLLSDQIQVIKDKLSPFGKITIIVYIRRPDGWITSRYSQAAKTGRFLGGFSEYVDLYLEKETFEIKLNRWASAFGKENIRVKVLEKSQIEGHLFHDFLRTIGIDDFEKFPCPDSQNISPTIKELEILKFLLERIDVTIYQKLVPNVGYLARCLRSFAIQNDWDVSASLNLVDQEIYKKIEDKCGESYRNIARTYLGRDELFLEKFIPGKEVSTYSISELSGEESAEIFSFLINELLAFLDRTVSRS